MDVEEDVVLGRMAFPGAVYASRRSGVQCTHPVRLPTRPGDARGMLVPCGKCVGCRIAHAREWSVRMWHEATSWDKVVFVTLTYDDDHVPYRGTLMKGDLQDFFKRLRIRSDPLKYYACGEYGENTSRPHYHAIIFGRGPEDREAINKAWGQGYVSASPVSYKRMQYVAKYVGKAYFGDVAKEVYGDRLPPFQLTSQGLGREYARKNRVKLMREQTDTINGVKVGIPGYYKRVLWLDPDNAVEHAIEREEDLQTELRDKGLVGETEQCVAVYASHAQRERELRAKLDRAKRDIS